MNIRAEIDETAKKIGGASDLVVRSTVRTVQENPIPIVLIGVGVTWLVVDAILRRPRTGYEVAGPYAVYEGYDEDVGLKAQLAARMAVAKARLSSAFDKYGEGVGGARERAADLAHAAQARADAYGRAARRKIDEVTENEPLAIGAAGLVLGAAIALALAAATGKKD